MAADLASYELGVAAAADAASLQQALQCHACGALRRPAFLRGIQDAAAQQPEPLALLQLLSSCINSGLFGLQLLQAALPDPVAACSVIHRACCSGAASQGCQFLPPAAVQQLLLQLLISFLDGDGDDNEAAAAAAGLHEYVAATLQHLQEAATQHQVLAAALLDAAAACGPLTGTAAPGRWLRSLLRSLLTHRHTAAATASAVQLQAACVAKRSWECLAAGHSCWSALVGCSLSCMTADELLQEIVPVLQDAALTAQGQDGMCAALAAVSWSAGQLVAGGGAQRSGDAAAAVVEALRREVTAALVVAELPRLLPPLLVAQQLLAPGAYSSLLQTAAAAALLSKDPGNAGAAGWSCCTKALRLLLPAAGLPVLEANLQLLGSLQGAAPTALLRHALLRHEVSSTVEDLRSAVAALKAQQQAERQQQGASAKLNTNYQLKLSMFAQQQPSHRTGRREVADNYTGALGAQWARQLADALLQPPDDPYWAAVRWEYLQGLEDRGLVAGKAGQFRAACRALGIDIDAARAAGAGGAAAASEAPLAVLTRLLASLPSAVRESMELPMLRRMFGRMTDLLGQVLQQQQQQQGSAMDDAPPAAKRQHVCGGAVRAGGSAPQQHQAASAAAGWSGGPPGQQEGSSSSSSSSPLVDHLVDLLLQAHDATLTQPGGLGLPWRLAFLRLLQAASGQLQGRLVARLQCSMTGVDEACSQARVCCHGRLLALMAAATPADAVVLQPSSDALLLSQPVAAPLFTWQLSHGGAGGAGKGSGSVLQRWLPGSLAGWQLAELLMGRTLLGSWHQRCCAASFWAGYASELQRLQAWCAGRYGPFHLPQQQQQQQQPEEQPQLLGFAPPQLVALLQAVAAQLAEGAAAGEGCTPGGGTGASTARTVGEAAAAGTPQGTAAVLRAAQKACSGALRSQPVRWACQLLQ